MWCVYIECKSHASNLIGSLCEPIQVNACTAAFRNQVNQTLVCYALIFTGTFIFYFLMPWLHSETGRFGCSGVNAQDLPQ